MPHVARITIHPVKGLDGAVVEQARATTSGALEDDRRWRLVDAEGAEVTPSRFPPLAHLQAEFDLPAREIRLAVGPRARGRALPAGRFRLDPGPDGPCRWLSSYLGMPVTIEERPEGGFPDDVDAPGPVIAAVASLEEVARWFALGLDEARQRFRVGIEIGGCDAFWEDTLAAPARPRPAPTLRDVSNLPADPWGAAVPLEPLRFAIGLARYRAVAVRDIDREAALDPPRCHDPEHFRPIFEAWRRRTLRRDVDASAWDGMDRLAVTTIGDGAGGHVRVGDAVVVGRHP